MPVTVTTPANSTDLTTTSAVTEMLGVTPSLSDQSLLASLVSRASSEIRSYCRRKFEREVVTETLPGFGRSTLLLERTPLVVVSELTYFGAIIPSDDYEIDDARAGTIISTATWEMGGAFASSERIAHYLDFFVRPDPANPGWQAKYAAGWLLPNDDIAGASISVDATNKAFTGSFPATIQAGDTFTTSGFTNSGNNGTFIVVTASSSEITVDSTNLVTESSSSVDIKFRNLPEDVEMAALVLVRSMYFSRNKDPFLTRERLGARTYLAEYKLGAIPPEVRELLIPYRRML